MSKVLVVKSSPSGQNSASNKLVDAVVEKIKSKESSAIIKEVDLAVDALPHLDGLAIASFFTPMESRNETLNNAAKVSDQAVADLKEADIIVIGIPMYNFGIPSSLKAWIDHIARVGQTFYFDENGMPRGMVHDKKVLLTIASGGIYSEGMLKPLDFTESYMRAILGYLGITDISVVRSEGSSIPDIGEKSLQKGMEMVNSLDF